MTPLEFSHGFDTLLNSQGAISGFGQQDTMSLDEYEKSFFLTEAQHDIIVELYNGNLVGKSFEENEELRQDLEKLITCATFDLSDVDEEEPFSGKTLIDWKEGIVGEDKTTKDYPIFMVIRESADLVEGLCEFSKTTDIPVVPVKTDDYSSIKENPFRRANSRRITRRDKGNGTVELHSSVPIHKYYLEYLRKPQPIVTAHLDGVTVEGVGDESECELDNRLHIVILERAVQLAMRRFPQQATKQ